MLPVIKILMKIYKDLQKEQFFFLRELTLMMNYLTTSVIVHYKEVVYIVRTAKFRWKVTNLKKIEPKLEVSYIVIKNAN